IGDSNGGQGSYRNVNGCINGPLFSKDFPHLSVGKFYEVLEPLIVDSDHPGLIPVTTGRNDRAQEFALHFPIQFNISEEGSLAGHVRTWTRRHFQEIPHVLVCHRYEGALGNGFLCSLEGFIKWSG